PPRPRLASLRPPCHPSLASTPSETTMSLLARFQVLTKIIAVVMLLSALAAGITWLGVHSLSLVNAEATEMSSAAQRALIATRATQAVLVLNRTEYAAALDPTPQNRAEMHKAIEAQLKNFQ